MKRIIREIITLVRIERWLVQDDMPLTGNHDPDIEYQSEESIIDGHEFAADDLRVIAQRILESKQWERASDGTFSPKRLPNDPQTPKEGNEEMRRET